MSKIQEIIDKVDFVDLVSRKTTLKRVRDNQYKGLSPFTNEKTPSFFLNNASKIWYCYSSGVGGGVIDYVQKVENLDQNGALQFLAELTGVELESISPEETNIKKALQLAHSYFRENSDKAREYLVERGFAPDVVDKYEIGYIGYGDELVKFLRKNNVSDRAMEEAGLCFKHEATGALMGSFFNRLMIPIRDAYGTIVSFTGRDISGKATAKYKHGQITSVFKKKNIVWNLNQARALIAEKDMVVVCEGQMDAIAVNEAGIPAVATLGTSISKEQLEQLSKHASNIYIVFDSDSAGEKGLLRASNLAQEADIDSVVYAVVLPAKGRDPEDFLREFGVEEFREVLNESKADTSAIVQSLIRSLYQEGLSKAAIARKVLYELRNSFKHTFTYRSFDLIERLSQEFSFSKKQFMEWMDSRPSLRKIQSQRIDEMAFPAPIYERRILIAVLNEPILIKQVKAHVQLTDFDSLLVCKILQYCDSTYDSYEYFEVLKDNLDEEDYYRTLEMFSQGVGEVDFESALQILRYKVSERQSGIAHRNFIGRPHGKGEEYRLTVKDMVTAEERIIIDEHS